MLWVGKREVNVIILTLSSLEYNSKSLYYAKPLESNVKINIYLKNKSCIFMLT